MFQKKDDRGIYTVCRSCRNKVHIAELKQDPQTKVMICYSCYGEKTNFKEERQALQLQRESAKQKGNIKYICKWCEYKFYSNKELGYYDACPACNKKNTLYKDIKSADILRDSTLNR